MEPPGVCAGCGARVGQGRCDKEGATAGTQACPAMTSRGACTYFSIARVLRVKERWQEGAGLGLTGGHCKEGFGFDTVYVEELGMILNKEVIKICIHPTSIRCKLPACQAPCHTATA